MQRGAEGRDARLCLRRAPSPVREARPIAVRLLAVVFRLDACRDLPDLFERIATSVVEALGIEMAAIFLVGADGHHAAGAPLGILSLDCPENGRLPNADQQVMLELLVAKAARAFRNHVAGDHLLSVAGQRLGVVLRSRDVKCRVGGMSSSGSLGA